MSDKAAAIPPGDKPGKFLEREVADLLRAAGYRVTPENLVGSKRVDLYCEEERRGSTVRIAVECRDHAGVLSQSDIVQVYSAYRPLYDGGKIDELFLISRHGLAPAAVEYVRLARGMTHMTVDDLHSQLIDFRPYMQYLIDDFNTDGLSSYFIKLCDDNARPLDESVTEWLSGRDEAPLAILAGYGMGKTSFTRFFAHELAQHALRDPTCRIPILVRLGDISSEQSLEGLLGKLFTSITIVRGYSFPLFMSLHRAGRFVIFLDGFDEMKHTLSWDEFRYNFRQLNRLVTGRGRVILLGRPTAFLSDVEHNMVLRGVRYVGEQATRDDEWPRYREIYIRQFDRDQVERFLNLYFIYKKREAEKQHNRTGTRGLGTADIERVAGKQFADIARRPVQLKMLAEVLPQYKGALDTLTTAILYDEFIDLMIAREQEKLARRRFRTSQRRQFLEDVAWWLWTQKKEMAVDGEAVPDVLVRRFCKEDDDIQSVRRDLMAACFLERKLGQALYFPHRSFHEFLVAHSIQRRLSDGTVQLEEVVRISNPEIYAFLQGLVNIRTFSSWAGAMERYHGAVPMAFAQVWVSDYLYADFIAGKATDDAKTPWWILFLTLGFCMGRFPDNVRKPLSTALLASRSSGEAKVLALLCSLAYFGRTGDAEPLITLLVRSEGEREQSVRSVLSKVQLIPQGRRLDLRGVYPVAAQVLEPFCIVKEWIRGHTLIVDAFELPTSVSDVPADSFEAIRRAKAQI